MTDKIYRDVAPVSGEDRAAILRKTAHSLPDSPSAAGMKPDQIRRHFWSAIVGERQSVLREIDRVIEEVNAALDELWALLYGTVELGGKEIRLSDLIYTGLAEGYTLSDLLGGLADGSALSLISSGVTGYSMEQYLAMLKREIDRKAQKGDKGDPGDAAGFGEITVETVTEAPDQAAAVEVVADGEDVAKNFRFVFRIPQGKPGDRGLQGPPGIQGIPGIQGPQGKPFGLAKIYPSEDAMFADFGNADIAVGDFVMINTGDVEDEENSRIYVKTEDKYSYVTDMSGATGIQGPQGLQGIPGKDLSKEVDSIFQTVEEQGGHLDTLQEHVDRMAEDLLPEVTEDDDGKVLTVVDGAWTAGDAPSGGATSWDDLTDRPFYEKAARHITFNGTTDVTDIFQPHGTRNVYYKITDEVFTFEQIKASQIFIGGNEWFFPNLRDTPSGCVQSNWFCSLHNTEVNLGIASDGQPDVFPSTGTYVGMASARSVELIVPEYIKKLDEKFLPDDIGEPPVFDLADFGIEYVPLKGGLLRVTDATALMEALGKGAVKVKFKISDELTGGNAEINCEAVMNNIRAEDDAYICSYAFDPSVYVYGEDFAFNGEKGANMITLIVKADQINSFVTEVATKGYVQEKIAAIEIPEDASGLPEVTTNDNGKVLTVVGGKWEAKNAPSGGGGGGGVSSWNDLTDKPFWDEKTEVDIFEEKTLGFAYLSALGTYGHYIREPFFVFEEGTTYTIVWDGVEYKRTAFAHTSPIDGGACVSVGNPLVTGAASNGDVFAILCELQRGMVYFLSLDTSASHTVAIYQEKTIIKHLDNKYLAILEYTEGTATETELFPKTTEETVFNSAFNAYAITKFVSVEMAMFWHGYGEEKLEGTVYVDFDGVTYACEPQAVAALDDAVGVGNFTPFGGTGNNEPFAISILADLGDEVSPGGYLMVGALQDTSPTEHTVRIYQKTEGVAGGYKVKHEYPLEQPVSIDMSAFESEGKIVEVFADGTKKTTVVELNGIGNPSKITDSDGNVIQFMW